MYNKNKFKKNFYFNIILMFVKKYQKKSIKKMNLSFYLGQLFFFILANSLFSLFSTPANSLLGWIRPVFN